jgi:hypothetical protein
MEVAFKKSFSTVRLTGLHSSSLGFAESMNVLFYTDLIKDAFLPVQHTQASGSDDENTSAPSHPDFFVETPIQTLQVNASLSSNDHIRNYEFLGRVLGKTMYESILVDPQFSLPFLNSKFLLACVV